MTLFRNTFRNESARHPAWDYSSSGSYFITICVRPRNPVFGIVDESGMHLTDAGKIAQSHWQMISRHYPEVEPGPVVVMPDHIHGIITIHERHIRQSASNAAGKPVKCHSLGNIVGSYKSAVTKMIREGGVRDFRWQERFYDRIIRNDAAFRQIERYISENPRKWREKYGCVRKPGDGHAPAIM